VLLAVAAVAVLIFVDPSVYRNQLETRASAAFSRQFKINGPIRLVRTLRPRIILENFFPSATRIGPQVRILPLLKKSVFRWRFYRCCAVN